mmetsp:Transcript_26725/g.61972  ORF Transcript_26725/g.61972 Transcript_26725/m.61972 type:complete len:80 (+) Transcript_26725:128-367(+)
MRHQDCTLHQSEHPPPPSHTPSPEDASAVERRETSASAICCTGARKLCSELGVSFTIISCGITNVACTIPVPVATCQNI